MKALSTLFILLLIGIGVHAQQTTALDGHWKGSIDVRGSELIIETHFPDTDSLRGTIDIPQQGAQGIPLQSIQVTDADSVFFEFQAGPGLARFTGAFRSDSAIRGTFHQRGMQFPFELKRYTPETNITHKKEQRVRPYHHKDLSIKNDSIKIGGTLTRPKDEQTEQLVIMISGSGAQNRDEEIPVTDFKPFAVMADSLTRAGLATFRYDDRGVGESTGRFDRATVDMLADDVDAIISEFTDGSGHNFEQFILLGHSLGGIVGSRVAVKNKSVDKLILMASPGEPLKNVLRFQLRQRFEQSGVNDTLIEAEISARENLMKAIADDKNIEQKQKTYEQKFEAVQLAVGLDSTRASKLARQQARQLTASFETPQMQSLFFHDPAGDLQKINIPVLALFGGKDSQVPAEINKPPVTRALEKAGVKYKIKVFEDANHLFQKAKTGQVREYSQLENRFVNGFTKLIKQWIKE